MYYTNKDKYKLYKNINHDNNIRTKPDPSAKRFRKQNGKIKIKRKTSGKLGKRMLKNARYYIYKINIFFKMVNHVYGIFKTLGAIL